MTGLISRRRALTLSAASVATFAGGGRAFSADYPTRAITLVVPYSPGGGTDVAGRLVAAELQQIFKQSVVVLNKSGGGSIIGTQFVARATPDGYTLLFTACDGMVMDPAIYQNLPYDAMKDFSPISDIVTFPLFVIVKGDSPFKTLRDLVDYVKANPSKANYASSSSVFWLASELFAQQAGVKATRVPYKGAGDMVLAVLQGEVLFALPSPPPVLGHATAGAIRILATTAPERLPGLPDIPTMAEAGVSGVTVTDWSGLWAPANTRSDIVAALNKAVCQALTSPGLKAKAAQLNLGVAGSTVDSIKHRMVDDLKQWQTVAQKANISVKL
ncbi:MAG TPA: tripartite tricarboxylate transporter substrate binding protein [Pseudolabrys sp.]|jgi:tripartite-type tricarboxylate transporter receptor subunit TctC